MKEDRNHKLYHNGFKAGQEHKVSSPQTILLLNKFKKEMSEELREIRRDVKEVIKAVSTLDGKVCGFAKNIDNNKNCIDDLYDKDTTTQEKIKDIEISISKIAVKVGIIIGGTTFVLYLLSNWIINKI